MRIYHIPTVSCGGWPPMDNSLRRQMWFQSDDSVGMEGSVNQGGKSEPRISKSGARDRWRRLRLCYQHSSKAVESRNRRVEKKSTFCGVTPEGNTGILKEHSKRDLFQAL